MWLLIPFQPSPTHTFLLSTIYLHSSVLIGDVLHMYISSPYFMLFIIRLTLYPTVLSYLFHLLISLRFILVVVGVLSSRAAFQPWPTLMHLHLSNVAYTLSLIYYSYVVLPIPLVVLVHLFLFLTNTSIHTSVCYLGRFPPSYAFLYSCTTCHHWTLIDVIS